MGDTCRAVLNVAQTLVTGRILAKLHVPSMLHHRTSSTLLAFIRRETHIFQ